MPSVPSTANDSSTRRAGADDENENENED